MLTTPDGKKLVTLIPGDGIGPECVEASRRIVEATGAKVAWEVRSAGESVFKKGIPSGVPPETIESVRKTRVVLKGPLGTPAGCVLPLNLRSKTSLDMPLAQEKRHGQRSSQDASLQ